MSSQLFIGVMDFHFSHCFQTANMWMLHLFIIQVHFGKEHAIYQVILSHLVSKLGQDFINPMRLLFISHHRGYSNELLLLSYLLLRFNFLFALFVDFQSLNYHYIIL
jgi:hypothetical protein